MIATCPACHWRRPGTVSSHGAVSYLRCVCGLFLVLERGVIIATAGTSTFAPIHHSCGDLASVPTCEPS